MGLIYPEGYYKNQYVEIEYKGEKIMRNKPGRFYIIGLEDEGIAKAKELLAL